MLLLLVPFVLAETLHTDEKITISGKVLILDKIGMGMIVVEVDGEKAIIDLDQTKIVNDLQITVTEVFYVDEIESRYASFTAEYVGGGEGDSDDGGSGDCGNDDCEDDEDESNCCLDCGCKVGYSCVSNSCKKNECEEDSECRDTDFCTLDKCTGKPKKCTRTKITECVVNDKCCPGSCYWPDDPDCSEDKVKSGSVKNESNKENESSEENEELEGNDSEVEDNKSETKDDSLEGTNGEGVGFFKKIVNWFKNLFR